LNEKQNPILEYANSIILGIGGLHDFQDYELAYPNYDRDVSTAIWVIKCLANPRSEGSKELLKLITERRKELGG
jgi:hypothetical protein